MPEPTFFCAAPIMADESQKMALYSHYAAVVVPAATGAVMFVRSRVYGKVAHICAGVGFIGIACAALYSQSVYNRFLFKDIESAVPAITTHVAVWSIAAVLLMVYASTIPGFFFKRAKKFATIILSALAFIAFGLIGLGTCSAVGIVTVPPLETIKEAGEAAQELIHSLALFPALAFALPGAVMMILSAVLFFVFKSGQGKETMQARPATMAVFSTVFAGLLYAACAFFASSKPDAQGVATSVLMMNVADVVASIFVLVSSISIIGTEKDFPKPVKPPKPKKEKAPAPAPAPVAPQAFPGAVPAVDPNFAAQQAAMLQQMMAAQQATGGAALPPPPPGMTQEQYQAFLQQQAYAMAMAQYQAQLLAQQAAAQAPDQAQPAPQPAAPTSNLRVARPSPAAAPARPATRGRPAPASTAKAATPATPASAPRGPRKFVRPTRPTPKQ